MLPLPLIIRNGRQMAFQIAILGAGDLGRRVAQQRIAAGDAVATLRRRPVAMPEGVQAVTGDLSQREDLKRLPAAPDWLVFCATPDARNEAAYRRLYVEGLAIACEVLQPKRCLLVSSTAVYAQDAGEWVDETSPAMAESFNGRMLREAERQNLMHSGNRVLRLSGITGPGRNMLINKALLGEGIANAWSNRIHIADAATAVSHLLDLPDPEPLWIASDNEPALQLDVANWIRASHGLAALPGFAPPPSGRRVGNARLKGSGWQPEFPSYRQSYAIPGV